MTDAMADAATQQSKNSTAGDGSDAPPKSKNLAERILQAIDDLVTLNIVTIVNDGGPPKKMTSKVDLIDGDITTEFDIAFVTGNLKELRDYHIQREAQGHKIIIDNIEALGKLIELFLSANDHVGDFNRPAQ